MFSSWLPAFSFFCTNRIWIEYLMCFYWVVYSRLEKWVCAIRWIHRSDLVSYIPQWFVVRAYSRGNSDSAALWRQICKSFVFEIDVFRVISNRPWMLQDSNVVSTNIIQHGTLNWGSSLQPCMMMWKITSAQQIHLMFLFSEHWYVQACFILQ